jgi:outer membrane protein OmpA-like peptidoglycan-associated protein
LSNPQLFAKFDRFGTRLQIMAERLPKASEGKESVSGVHEHLKTPAGVWVIIGMVSLFAAAGLGAGIFIAFKTIVQKKSPSNPVESADLGRMAAMPAARTGGVEHPTAIGKNDDGVPSVADRAEEDAMRQEVLNRIDLVKFLSQGDKDKLYAQVERARAFKKIAIIPFSKSGTAPGSAQIEALVRHFKKPEMQKLLSDPTVLFVMVGFADKQGEESKNLEVSRARAESVVKALREKVDVLNVMHSVGMGGQNLFDQTNPEKNRLVEVWAVQP